jgi:hypothetical protein
MPSGFRFVSRSPGGVLRDGEVMRAPYGLEIIENCLSCPHRQDRLFCNLSLPAVESLSAITSAAVYPKGVTLFVEGAIPTRCFRVMQRQSEALDLFRGRKNPHLKDFGIR